MIAFKILLGALLFVLGAILLVLLLCCFSVRLHLSYISGEIKATAHYLFIRYRLLPEKPEKPGKPKKPKKKKKQETVEATPGKKREPLRESLERYRPLLSAAKENLRKLCKRIIIYNVDAQVGLASADAHKTALLYTKTANFLNILLILLKELFTVKIKSLLVSPDFTGDKSSADISLWIRIRPIVVIPIGIVLFLAYLKTLSYDKSKKSQLKGGNQYEQSSNR